jgi:hypothetical protein
VVVVHGASAEKFPRLALIRPNQICAGRKAFFSLSFGKFSANLLAHARNHDRDFRTRLTIVIIVRDRYAEIPRSLGFGDV